MSGSRKTYTFRSGATPDFPFTVVQMADGKFLEVRRGCITWTAAFRAANPGVTQRVFNSLQDWHYSFNPTTGLNMGAWKMSRGWAAPALPAAGEKCYWLSIFLSNFMGGASATEEQLADAITEFSEMCPDSPLLTFLLGKDAYEAISSGDILGALMDNGHILEEVVKFPGIDRWQVANLAELALPDSGELTFSPELRYFLQKPSGSWEDILRAFRSYGIFHKCDSFNVALALAGLTEKAEDTGYICADAAIRSLFGLDDGGKGLLAFSDFRKQMLERAHIRITPPVVELMVSDADSDSSCSDMEIDEESDDDSDYVPSESESESESDSESDTDYEDMPALEPVPEKNDPFRLLNSVLEFNRRWNAERAAPAPSPVVEAPKPLFTFSGAEFVEEKEAKPTAPVAADPFAEIHDVFVRVQADLNNPENNRSYQARLASQFVSFCLRPSFGVLWRSNAFERLQMRATLLEWVECGFVGDEAAYPTLVVEVERFNKTYPV